MAIGGNTADSLSTQTKFTLGAAGTAATSAASGKTGATVLGPEAVLTGDIKSKNDVIIAGSIEGEVTSDTKVIIAQSGTVKGRVVAAEVVIEGRLSGDSQASQSLSILSNAEVRGDITTPVIMIEPGATFIGRCSMTEQAQPQPAKQ